MTSLLPSPVRRWLDRVLGRGDAACTVPSFDGVLRPNQVLEEAPVVARFDAPNDLVSDGRHLYIADGPRLLAVDPDTGATREITRFDDDLTALACRGTQIAVAIGGRRVEVHRLAEDASALKLAAGGPAWPSAGAAAWVSINSLAFVDDDTLVATEGSATRPFDAWCHDLMTIGRSGRVFRLRPGGVDLLADHLAFAFGALPMPDGSTLVAESWQHRVLRLPRDGAARKGSSESVLDRLPGYPSRLAPAADGGAWLTVFATRTQLVEFVLREKAYRERMVAEVDPRYWVAPALSSGNSFLEPLQGGGVKTMGVLKPWAPPRSYGLVIRLDPHGRPVASLHSRVGGRHHGVVAAAECGGNLFVLAKGSASLLRITPGDEAARSASDALAEEALQ